MQQRKLLRRTVDKDATKISLENTMTWYQRNFNVKAKYRHQQSSVTGVLVSMDKITNNDKGDDEGEGPESVKCTTTQTDVLMNILEDGIRSSHLLFLLLLLCDDMLVVG